MRFGVLLFMDVCIGTHLLIPDVDVKVKRFSLRLQRRGGGVFAGGARRRMLEVGRSHSHATGELHLRKELIALKRARCLRDPSTCSSWKPPKSPVSTIAASAAIAHGAAADAGRSSYEFAAPGDGKLLCNWRNQANGCTHQTERTYDEAQNVAAAASKPRRNKVFKKSAARNGRNAPGVRCLNRNQEIEASIRALSLVQEQGYAEDAAAAAFDGGFRKSKREPSLDCNSRSGSPLLVKDGFRAKASKRGHSLNLSKAAAARHREESLTPVSSCSYNRNGDQSHSVIGSWDGEAFSDDEDMDDGLDLRRHGCGIPCYWSRTPKHRGSGTGGSFSPSLSDSVRRKVSNMVSKNQSRQGRKDAAHLLISASRHGHEGLPLLTDGGEDRSLSEDGSSSEEGTLSDGRSSKLAQLDMEAACKLDMDTGMKSRHISQERLELALAPPAGSSDLAVYDGRHRSLSQKYRPKCFDELVGQNMVVQTLASAILRGKIAPVYLFQGPRGTGKTSTARIFAAAVNCLSPENLRPCGFCRQCTDLMSGRSVDVREFDATSSNGVEKAKCLLKNVALAPSLSRFKVFIIDECHVLASETWTALLKILEEPPRHVVFILITTDSDKIPRTAVSRCQKYLFTKIKDTEIVSRCQKLAIQEGLDVDSDALEMIAAKSDGSLRDAETMLDQLSLLGQRITLSMVHELMGVVSDEDLLDLLELALSADTARTVKRTRELLDSGIEPMALMAQLATRIMDILAGSFKLSDVRCTGIYFNSHALTEEQLERLRRALKILSEAEKQLRVSNEQTTWLTAALLQFGGGKSIPFSTSSATSLTQSPVILKEKNESSFICTDSSAREISRRQQHCGFSVEKSHSMIVSSCTGENYDNNNDFKKTRFKRQENKEMQKQALGNLTVSELCNNNEAIGNNGHADLVQKESRCLSSAKLNDIWRRFLEECKPNSIRQLLYRQAKLSSVSIKEGFALVQVEFCHIDQKTKAEKHLQSIANAFHVALGCDIEVRISVASFPTGENICSRKSSSGLLKAALKQRETVGSTTAVVESDRCSLKHDHKEVLTESLKGTYYATNGNLQGSSYVSHNGIQDYCKVDDSVADEQRLESAWLQAAEKCAPGLKDILKPEKNQVLPRDAVAIHNGFAGSRGVGNVPLAVALQHNDQPSKDEIKVLMNENGIDNCNHRPVKGDKLGIQSGSLEEGYFITALEEETLQDSKGSVEEKLVYFCGLCLVPSRKGSARHT